ncbi:MarR family winged helix-turn-helix transcriptional regulator [Comamonadaceae bacterium PP-2]
MTETDPAAYDFSAQVGHLLRRAYQRHTALFQQFIPDSQLTVAQFVVLCALRDQGGSSMSDIVKATVIDQATIRGVIDRLKVRKLVHVGHDPSDRRKVVVALTDEGADMVRQMEPFAQTITEQTFGPLNPAERVALVYLLRRMCEAEIGDASTADRSAN